MRTKPWLEPFRPVELKCPLAGHGAPGSARILEMPDGTVRVRDQDFARAPGKCISCVLTGVAGTWLILQELWLNSGAVFPGFLATGIVLATVALVLGVLVVGSAAYYKEIIIERMGSNVWYKARTRSIWRGVTETEANESIECRVHDVHFAGIQVYGTSTSWDGHAATIYCGDMFVTLATRKHSEEIDEYIRALPEPLRSERWQRGASLTIAA